MMLVSEELTLVTRLLLYDADEFLLRSVVSRTFTSTVGPRVRFFFMHFDFDMIRSLTDYLISDKHSFMSRLLWENYRTVIPLL